MNGSFFNQNYFAIKLANYSNNAKATGGSGTKIVANWITIIIRLIVFAFIFIKSEITVIIKIKATIDITAFIRIMSVASPVRHQTFAVKDDVFITATIDDVVADPIIS